MAVNQISMAVNYRKNKSTTLSSAGKYYAEVDRQKTLSTRGLAQHLKEHNCMIGRDAIMAVLVKLSECVPELVAQGVGVKLDGLGTFYPSILNTKGGATEAQMKDKNFNPTSIIGGVRMRFSPDATELDNLTSKQFLARVSPESQNIVDVEARIVNGKRIKVQTLVSLEDFRNPGSAAPASGNSGSNSGNNGSTDSGNSGGNSGNSGSSSNTLAAPTISGNTTFSESSQVSISAADGAEIRYTLDGSTPTAESTLYSEAFTVTETTSVKAIAIKDGQTSEVASKTFVKSSGEGGMDQN